MMRDRRHRNKSHQSATKCIERQLRDDRARGAFLSILMCFKMLRNASKCSALRLGSSTIHRATVTTVATTQRPHGIHRGYSGAGQDRPVPFKGLLYPNLFSFKLLQTPAKRCNLLQFASKRIAIKCNNLQSNASKCFILFRAHLCIGGWRPHGKNFFRSNSNKQSGCGHRSGLIEADQMSAGLNGSPLDRVPATRVALGAHAQVRVSPINGSRPAAITSSSLSPIRQISRHSRQLALNRQAIAEETWRNVSPRRITAQAMRASLFATATVTTRAGRLASIHFLIHSPRASLRSAESEIIDVL
jgi:hypothetical protein